MDPVVDVLVTGLLHALEGDEGESLNFLVSLQRYPGRESVLDTCEDLARSASPTKRRAAADIIGAMSVGRNDSDARSVLVAEMFDSLLESKEPMVLAAVVRAAGRWALPEGLERLLALASHEAVEVRRAVAQALSSYSSSQAADSLVMLTTDRDPEVRSWAVLGLADMRFDCETTRCVLLRAALDDDDDVRGEAFAALASRKDERLVPILSDYLLNSREVGSLAVSSALEIRSPELCDALIQLRGWWDIDRDLLEQAISACSRM